MVNDNENLDTELTTEEQLEILTQKVKQNSEIIEEIAFETNNFGGITAE